MQKTKESRWQARTFWLCFLAYAFAYFCRVNLAVALSAIGRRFGFSLTALGTIGTSFFWTYALGQLINGYLGDRLSSRWFVGLGLSASALINLCFGFSKTLGVMVLLWGLNGFFQSMLWGPIMKTLANWLPDRPASETAIRISTSTIAGYFLAWGLSGVLVARLGWQFAFWLPAAVVLVFSACWLVLMREQPSSVGINLAAAAAQHADVHEVRPSGQLRLLQVAGETGLAIVAIACVAQGVIKDGISLWAPTMLSFGADRSALAVILGSLLIPLANFAGIWLSGWVNRRLAGGERASIAALLAGCGATAVLLSNFSQGLLTSAVLLAATSCLVYGANTLLITLIPLRYQRYGLTSTVAGGLDAAAYLGAALSGLLNGWLADNGGWGEVGLIWGAVGLGAALLLTVTRPRSAASAD